MMRRKAPTAIVKDYGVEDGLGCEYYCVLLAQIT